MGVETIVTCLQYQVFKHATPLESANVLMICDFYRHEATPLRQPLCAFRSLKEKATR